MVKAAALLPQLKKPRGIVEAGPPLEAIRLKVRKQHNSRRAKRKDCPVRLKKLCIWEDKTLHRFCHNKVATKKADFAKESESNTPLPN